MSTPRPSDQLKPLARACEFCRLRKVKCNRLQPARRSCISQKRQCVYKVNTPSPRPTMAELTTLRAEKQQLLGLLSRLELSTTAEASALLNSIRFNDASDSLTTLPAPAQLCNGLDRVEMLTKRSAVTRSRRATWMSLPFCPSTIKARSIPSVLRQPCRGSFNMPK